LDDVSAAEAEYEAHEGVYTAEFYTDLRSNCT